MNPSSIVRGTFALVAAASLLATTEATAGVVELLLEVDEIEVVRTVSPDFGGGSFVQDRVTIPFDAVTLSGGDEILVDLNLLGVRLGIDPTDINTLAVRFQALRGGGSVQSTPGPTIEFGAADNLDDGPYAGILRTLKNGFGEVEGLQAQIAGNASDILLDDAEVASFGSLRFAITVPAAVGADREFPTVNVLVAATVFNTTEALPMLFAIEVSAEARIDALLGEVFALLEEGALDSGDANSLAAKLGGAADALERGNDRAAAGKLGAFANQVRALANSHRLDESIAADLIAAAEAAID